LPATCLRGDANANPIASQTKTMMTNEVFGVSPAPPPTEIAACLNDCGHSWTPLLACAAGTDRATASDAPNPTGVIAVFDVDDSLGRDAEDQVWDRLRALRDTEPRLEPVLIVLPADRLDQLDDKRELFDDFIIHPFANRELQARLDHLLWVVGRGDRDEIVRYGPIELNVETYQAQIGRRPLDLTYMEYELLRFLASNAGLVFSREVLLNRVWGYEYYGGARTVDVHVRRLRAKMGEEHAHLIQTIRSVGYKLGQGRWLESD